VGYAWSPPTWSGRPAAAPPSRGRARHC
jgi:hypothetical protein